MDNLPEGLLVVPRVRIQNANAISAPLTWGFPSMTAFLGLMWALERETAAACALEFNAVGVICHACAAQVARAGYERVFCLTRNPLDKKGATAGIVEEGRIHLELTLLFAVGGRVLDGDYKELQGLADKAYAAIEEMRVAGGTILPGLDPPAPRLWRLEEDPDKLERQFGRWRRSWLPGFALVSRHDLLQSRLEEMRVHDPQASALDAWLDLSSLHWRAEREGDGEYAKVTWKPHRRAQGWLVPIPAGYAALSPLHEPGEVAQTRDTETPFRFVESLYSIGEWVGAHRVANLADLLWSARYDAGNGLYLCRNDYSQKITK
ncbi:MAG: type I-F CRISPR-associated protein Csy2 [Deltaproteobacteria bacterium]|jgi:CRISPR-associated protein Csy2|nr:type I-F CRISPR-associated protein Csy2 [Deltaproteobacteria bacterium]